MCSKLKINKKIIEPGSFVSINNNIGSDVRIWGVDGIYNARMESKDTFWKNLHPCYVGIEGFYEGTGLFGIKANTLYAAGLYNDEGLLILTRPSVDTPVEKFHKRSIVLLEFGSSLMGWVKHRLIREIDYSLLRNIA